MVKNRVALCLILVLAFQMFCGCSRLEKAKEESKEEEFSVLSGNLYVNYIDVGEGDCIFIYFPDGKTMMIDCGDKVDDNLKKIEKVLDVFSVEKIDYLVLTHTDVDHIGNAKEIIEKYEIGTAYIPYVVFMDSYKNFGETVELLNEKRIDIIYSKMFDKQYFNDCKILFLSPKSFEISDSSYNDFNDEETVDKKTVNNISPIIYVEANNRRFLFTGDASNSQEKLVVNNCDIGYYNIFDKDLNLKNIDFLKVGHHGASDSSCREFLEYTMPNIAIISCGGSNFYGHPSSETLERIESVNENCKIYRTDVFGNITVNVSKDGNYVIENIINKK